MLPPLALAALGSLFAWRGAGTVAVLHAAAIFFAVYTAHVKDGYVDFHVRSEDDDHPLTARGCRLALGASTTGFAVCALAVGVLAGPLAAVALVPAWLLGYLHAPVLDVNPVTATVGYPAGNALALASAALAQGGTVPAAVGALAVVLFVLLSGVKVVDDAQDYAYDRSISKRTVAVVLGPHRARRTGFGLMALALVLTVAFSLPGVGAPDGVFPPSVGLSVFAFAAVAAVAYDKPPDVATMLLVRAGYVFLALVVAALWFRPMTAQPPVDITVLGPYTYLATEAVFGTLAVLLLHRAGALASAAKTVALLSPVAYVWDWYTLEVGVFAIPRRTGIEVLGIPLEEHLFIVVVPAFVLALHETRLRLQG